MEGPGCREVDGGNWMEGLGWRELDGGSWMQGFFNYVVSACEKKGFEFTKDGKPVYVLLETYLVSPFAFLRVQGHTYLFGFFDSDYQIIAESIIKYNH
jgi:hypothetical protein